MRSASHSVLSQIMILRSSRITLAGEDLATRASNGTQAFDFYITDASFSGEALAATAYTDGLSARDFLSIGQRPGDPDQMSVVSRWSVSTAARS